MADGESKIPSMGMARADVLERMRALRARDVRWEENRAFSLVFHQSDEHTDFLKEAHALFFEGNGLNPMAFESLRTFEHDVIRMTAQMLHGDSETVGTMTAGGTESIMLAVKTYRDRARKRRSWNRRPEIIVPSTAHVAFLKAGKYFDVRMVRAPIGKDGRVNVRALRRLVSSSTIAIVGSAPNYPNGTIDPIEELGAVAQEFQIGLHVDACIGGFFLPWAERLGAAVPPFDFRVPGVTSISADLHKYGYGAKGASTILYRSMDYLRHQFFVEVNWPGGVFASPSLPGTRPGGPIAAAWAALNAMGEDGYTRNAAQVLEIAKRFKDGINAIEGLAVLCDPPVGVFAYAPTDKRINCYALADQMTARGWHIDRQQKPASIHLMINPGHAKIVDQYLSDLHECMEFIRHNPRAALSGSAPAYGLIANAPMRRMVEKNVLEMMEAMFSAEGKLPELEGESGGGAPKLVMSFLRMKAWFAEKRERMRGAKK